MADNRVPELIADLEAQAVAFLTERQMSTHDAVLMSKKLAQHLCRNWGGQLIYIPKNQGGELDERDRQIYAEFNGRNHHELAKKYDLAVQQIYKIVKAGRAQFLAQNQQALFDDNEQKAAA